MAAPILPETMGAYSHTSEPVRFERDCSAVMVPSGEQHTLPAGAAGYITQALGGSFTVYVDGNLFRVRNEDADAIGKGVSIAASRACHLLQGDARGP